MTDTQFQVGDLADHKSGSLDPRPVARVEGKHIWLDILGRECGPFKAAHYDRIPARATKETKS